MEGCHVTVTIIYNNYMINIYPRKNLTDLSQKLTDNKTNALKLKLKK